MYHITLHTWYQETGSKPIEEIYLNKSFRSLDEAIEQLIKDKDSILEEFPVEKIEIGFRKTVNKKKKWLLW